MDELPRERRLGASRLNRDIEEMVAPSRKWGPAWVSSMASASKVSPLIECQAQASLAPFRDDVAGG
jgi:hypothetical protein